MLIQGHGGPILKLSMLHLGLNVQLLQFASGVAFRAHILAYVGRLVHKYVEGFLRWDAENLYEVTPQNRLPGRVSLHLLAPCQAALSLSKRASLDSFFSFMATSVNYAVPMTP